MTTRRDFLKQASLVAASGLLLGGSSSLLTSCKTKSEKKIGLQLYSLRDAMRDDVPGTLKKVADMGYTTLETAGYNDGKLYGMAPKEFRKMVEDLGMKVTGAHLGGGSYSKEKDQEIMDFWKKATDANAEVGARYLVQPSMSIPQDSGLDYLKAYCDNFNSVGYLTAASGIAFGYHNHDFEFKEIEGQIIYDYMIQNTSPNHVFFEMDVYWVQQGGYSPVDYLNKYAGRFTVLHIKDQKEIGESKTIDFEPIFNAAYAGGMKEFYVEVEQYNFDPVESVKQSYDFLAAAPYVK